MLTLPHEFAVSPFTSNPRRNVMNRKASSVLSLVASFAALMTMAGRSAAGATLCVNPGQSGCFATIGAAVAAAAANDTIRVAAGTYKEAVVIGKALSLIGAGRAIATIDATGLGTGIYVDGITNSGLSNVVISGF